MLLIVSSIPLNLKISVILFELIYFNIFSTVLFAFSIFNSQIKLIIFNFAKINFVSSKLFFIFISSTISNISLNSIQRASFL
jgi:hypothetical protein